MTVAPIQKSKISTSLAITKEPGVTLVNSDDKELPESFEYMKPEKLPGSR